METTKTPSQLNIDLAFHKARVQSLIDTQMRDAMYAFGVVDAPSALAENRCWESYWRSEETLQEHLTKIKVIKEQLRS